MLPLQLHLALQIFSFDAGKVDCYFIRLLTISIHSNDH